MSSITNFPAETRLLSVRNEHLVEVSATLPSEAGRRFFVAVARCGFLTDYPLMTAPGRVTWDSPELFSRRFRVRASRKISRLSRS